MNPKSAVRPNSSHPWLFTYDENIVRVARANGWEVVSMKTALKREQSSPNLFTKAKIGRTPIKKKHPRCGTNERPAGKSQRKNKGKPDEEASSNAEKKSEAL